MKYWNASALAEAPGCNPDLARDLRNANRRDLPDWPGTGEGAFMIAANGMVIGTYQPLALPPSVEPTVQPQPLYLRMPTPWEWTSLERAGLMEVPAGYYFARLALH